MSLVKMIKNSIKERPDLIITPRLEDWLEATPELVLRPEDEQLFLTLLRPSPNAVRAGRFGASSRGTCKRRQVFGFLGMPTTKIMDPQLQNIFNDGKFRHIRWQLMLLQAGLINRVEHRFKLTRYRLKVSLDGSKKDEGYFVEVKGMRSYTSTMTTVDEKHLKQIHTCMLASGIDTCVYIPEEKGTNDWREVVIHRDEEIMAGVKKELRSLNLAVDNRELPPVKTECRKKMGEYKQCPYAALCLHHEAAGDDWPEDGKWRIR